MVDLGNDYFLVSFSSTEDLSAVLTEGPWLIYDHYLIVREWTPNFDPMSASINKVAVWVRFSGLPLEYYDSKVLTFIGNRIGRTVRVDQNTLYLERGKYARLCVEVDLTKPLLAMFELQGRFYSIEYEGLHLLCLSCGRFGHYVEGCPIKSSGTARGGGVHGPTEGDEVGGRQQGSSERGDAGIVKDGEHGASYGPWMVVQKNRRPRKPPVAAGGG